jgi:hypothetical protein
MTGGLGADDAVDFLGRPSSSWAAVLSARVCSIPPRWPGDESVSWDQFGRRIFQSYESAAFCYRLALRHHVVSCRWALCPSRRDVVWCVGEGCVTGCVKDGFGWKGDWMRLMLRYVVVEEKVWGAEQAGINSWRWLALMFTSPLSGGHKPYSAKPPTTRHNSCTR